MHLYYKYVATANADCDVTVSVPIAAVDASAGVYWGRRENKKSATRCLTHAELDPMVTYSFFVCTGMTFEVSRQQELYLFFRLQANYVGVHPLLAVHWKAPGFDDTVHFANITALGRLTVDLESSLPLVEDLRAGNEVVATFNVNASRPSNGGELIVISAKHVTGPVTWKSSLSAETECQRAGAFVECAVGRFLAFDLSTKFTLRFTLASTIDDTVHITFVADSFTLAQYALPDVGVFNVSIMNANQYAPYVPAGVPVALKLDVIPVGIPRGHETVVMSTSAVKYLKWHPHNVSEADAFICPQDHTGLNYECDVEFLLSAKYSVTVPPASSLWVFFTPVETMVGQVGPIVGVKARGYALNKFTPDLVVLGYLRDTASTTQHSVTPSLIQPNPGLAQPLLGQPTFYPEPALTFGETVELRYFVKFTGSDSGDEVEVSLPAAAVVGAVKWANHTVDTQSVLSSPQHFCPITGDRVVCTLQKDSIIGNQQAIISLYFQPFVSAPGNWSHEILFTGKHWQTTSSKPALSVLAALDFGDAISAPVHVVSTKSIEPTVSLHYVIKASHNLASGGEIRVGMSSVYSGSLHWGLVSDVSGATNCSDVDVARQEWVCNLPVTFTTGNLDIWLFLTPTSTAVGFLGAPVYFKADGLYPMTYNVPPIYVVGLLNVDGPLGSPGVTWDAWGRFTTPGRPVVLGFRVSASGLPRSGIQQAFIKVPVSKVIEGGYVTVNRFNTSLSDHLQKRTEVLCNLTYKEHLCDITGIWLKGESQVTVYLAFIPPPSTVGHLGAGITFGAEQLQDTTVPSNITVLGRVTVVSDVYQPAVVGKAPELLAEVQTVLVGNLTLRASGMSVGNERVLIPLSMLQSGTPVHWMLNTSADWQACLPSGQFMVCGLPRAYLPEEFKLSLRFTVNSTLQGSKQFAMHFAADFFEGDPIYFHLGSVAPGENIFGATYYANLDLVPRVQMSTPASFHVATLKAHVDLTMCPTSPTHGGETLMIPASEVMDEVKWARTADESSAVACDDAALYAPMISCDLRSITFDQCQNVHLWFTPRDTTVGQWQGSFLFEAFDFAPSDYTPPLHVLAFVDPDRTSALIQPKADESNVLVSDFTVRPGLNVPAGTIVTMSFKLRSTGTSIGGERFSIAVNKVSGPVYWYATGNEEDAVICPVVGSEHHCNIGTNVTFFRNTDASFWVAFVPRHNITGSLNAQMTITADSFQPTVFTPALTVLGLLSPMQLGYPVSYPTQEVEVRYNITASVESSAGEVIRVKKGYVSSLTFAVSPSTSFVGCPLLGEDFVCGLQGFTTFGAAGAVVALKFVPNVTSAGMFNYPLEFTATGFAVAQDIPLINVLSTISVSDVVITPVIAKPGDRAIVRYDIAAALDAVAPTVIRIPKDGVHVPHGVAWGYSADELIAVSCRPDSEEFVCSGVPFRKSGVRIYLFVTPAMTTVGSWNVVITMQSLNFIAAVNTPAISVIGDLMIGQVLPDSPSLTGTPLLVHYRLIATGDSIGGEALTVDGAQVVANSVQWSTATNGARLNCTASSGLYNCDLQQGGLQWKKGGTSVFVWFVPVPTLIGDLKVPFTFSGNSLTTLADTLSVVVLGQFLFDVQLLNRYAPHVLSGEPIILAYNVTANGLTPGDETLRLNADKVQDGAVAWNTVNNKTSATMCPPVGLQHACDLSVLTFSQTITSIFLFFKPNVNHAGPLNADITFAGKHMKDAIPKPVSGLDFVLVIGYFEPLNTALVPDPLQPNILVEQPTVAPAMPRAGELVSLQYVLKSTATSFGNQSVEIPASAVVGTLHWGITGDESQSWECPQRGDMLVCQLLNQVVFSKHTAGQLWLFFMVAPVPQQMNQTRPFPAPITFKSSYFQDTQSYPNLQARGVFDLHLKSLSPIPFAVAGHEVTLFYSATPNVAIRPWQRVRISMPSAKIAPGTLHWINTTSTMRNPCLPSIIDGITTCELGHLTNVSASDALEVYLVFIPANGSVSHWNTGVSFTVDDSSVWAPTVHYPPVIVMGDINLETPITQLRVVEFERVPLAYNITASAEADIDVVLPASAIDGRPGTPPVVIGTDGHEGTGYDERPCQANVSRAGNNTVCTLKLAAGKTVSVWIWFSPAVFSGMMAITFEAPNFAISQHSIHVVSKLRPTWTSSPGSPVYQWRNMELMFKDSIFQPTADLIKVVSSLNQCSGPAVDLAPGLLPTGSNISVAYDTRVPQTGTFRVCYQFAGGFNSVEALGGLLSVIDGNPISYAVIPAQPRVDQLVTVQFSGVGLSIALDETKIVTVPHCHHNEATVNATLQGTSARPRFSVRLRQADTYYVCYRMAGATWATMPVPLIIRSPMPASMTFGWTGSKWPELGASEAVTMTFSPPGTTTNQTGYGTKLTPGADKVKVVHGSHECLDETLPVAGTNEVTLSAAATATFTIPLSGLYRVCYSLAGGDGTYADVRPPAAVSFSGDEFQMVVLAGQILPILNAQASKYEAVQKQHVILSYTLLISGNVTLSIAVPQEILAGNTLTWYNQPTSNQPCLEHACSVVENRPSSEHGGATIPFQVCQVPFGREISQEVTIKYQATQVGNWNMSTQFTAPGFDTQEMPHVIKVLPQPTWSTALHATVRAYEKVQIDFTSPSNTLSTVNNEDVVMIVEADQDCPGLLDPLLPAAETGIMTNLLPGDASGVAKSSYITSFTSAGTFKVCYLTRAAFMGHTMQSLAEAAGGLLTVNPANPYLYTTLPLDPRVGQNVTVMFHGSGLHSSNDRLKLVPAYLNHGTSQLECHTEQAIPGGVCTQHSAAQGVMMTNMTVTAGLAYLEAKFAQPGTYCVCYSWAGASIKDTWSTFPAPLVIAAGTPASYVLVTPVGDAGVQETITLSFAHNKTDLTIGRDQGKIVQLSQSCLDEVLPVVGTEETLLGPNYTMAFKFPEPGSYRVCYRLQGVYGSYASVGDVLNIGFGKFAQIHLHADSAIAVSSGDSYVLHYTVRTTSTITAAVSFLPELMDTLGPFFWDLDGKPSQGHDATYCEKSQATCYIEFTEEVPKDFYIYMKPKPTLLGQVPLQVTFSAPGYTTNTSVIPGAAVFGTFTPQITVLSTERKSGSAVTLRYELTVSQDTNTAMVSVPAEKLDGDLRMSLYPMTLDAAQWNNSWVETCTLDAAGSVACPLNTTFYRGSQVSIWFRFTPNRTTVGPLGAVFKFSATNFSNLLSVPPISVEAYFIELEYLEATSQVAIIDGERILLHFLVTATGTANVTVTLPSFLLEHVVAEPLMYSTSPVVTGTGTALAPRHPCTNVSVSQGTRTACQVTFYAARPTNLYLDFVLESHLLGRQPIDVDFKANHFVNLAHPSSPVVYTPNVSYAPFPHVYKITGCHDVKPVTVFCPANGTTPITIEGVNFLSSGAKVKVGKTECANVTHVAGHEDTRLVCSGYQQPTDDTTKESQVVTVTNSAREFSREPLSILMNLVPIVYSVSGCVTQFGKSTVGCDRRGQWYDLTITGDRFGRDETEAQVFIGNNSCQFIKRLSPRKLICVRNFYAEEGPNNRVRVVVRGESSKQTDVMVSFSELPLVYSVKGCGECDYTCTSPDPKVSTNNCPKNGTQPLTVHGDYFGEPSTKPKLVLYFGDPLENITCQNLSHVNDSVLICYKYPLPAKIFKETKKNLQAHVVWNGFSSPYTNAWMSYALRCGDLEVACSGHGACNLEIGTCTCDYSISAGFWSGEICEQCESGYFGSKCASQCPGGACNPCSGRGTCDDGMMGTGTCHCAYNYSYGYWGGPACDTCATGFWGLSCKDHCPAVNGLVCNGKGTCNQGRLGTGQCTCAADQYQGWWAGATCEECQPGTYGKACRDQCPGGVYSPCNGHGTCSSGVNGFGNCTCQDGFKGPACEFACPTQYAVPCGGPQHGVCVADSKVGAKCVCNSGYAGPACDQGCPIIAGTVCNGHGSCAASTDIPDINVCQCSVGWAGTGCTECVSGYFGASCDQRCPGTANVDGTWNNCNSASGRGTCNNLTTICSCATGYLGDRCHLICPGRYLGAAFTCNGHGTCSENNGSATCNCLANDVSGYWAKDKYGDCTKCMSGFYGDDCNSRCPGSGTGATVQTPCNGHGTCDGHGKYAGVCLCQAGYYGTTCQCETANAAVNPNDAECSECPSGYWNPPVCDKTCPGVDFTTSLGTARSCNIHGRSVAQGQCDTITGDCRCNKTAAGQYLWTGQFCQLPCPPNTLDSIFAGTYVTPCNGHGVCVQNLLADEFGSGICDCEPGYAGYSCSILCPGATPTDVSSICGGHGTCDLNTLKNGDLTYVGTGTCTCETGYAGAGCQTACPRGTLDNPDGPICGGHGTCLLSGSYAGTCLCEAGWDSAVGCKQCKAGRWGPKCDRNCTNSAGEICSGKGYCFDGVAGSGSCSCNAGYGGSLCQVVCPVANEQTCGGGAKGYCDVATGSCTCTKTCRDPNPLAAALTSTTDAPTVAAKWLPDWYIAADTCTSYDGGYYGDSCEVYCNPWQAVEDMGVSTTGGFVHAACNTTGGYICLQDSIRGYWDGATCDSCAVGYRGELCNKECLCNGHGSCDRYGTTCYCFQDDVNGYWDGVDCGTCSGSYGPEGRCTELQSAFTRTDTILSSDPLFNTFDISVAGLQIDTAQPSDPMYAGGRPIVVTALNGDYKNTMLKWYLCVRDPTSCTTDDNSQGVVSAAFAFNGDLSAGSATGPTDFIWFSVRARPRDYVCRMRRLNPDFQAATTVDYVTPTITTGACPSTATWCCKNAANSSSIQLVDFSISEQFAVAQTSVNSAYANRIFFTSQALVSGQSAAAVIPVSVHSDGDFTVQRPEVINGMSSVAGINVLGDNLVVEGPNAVDNGGLVVTQTISGIVLKTAVFGTSSKRRSMQITATSTDTYAQYITIPGQSGVICQHEALVDGFMQTVGSYTCTFVMAETSTSTYGGVTYEFSYRIYEWSNPDQRFILAVVRTQNFNSATTDAEKQAAISAHAYDSLNAEVTAMALDVRQLNAEDIAKSPVTQRGLVYIAVNKNSPSNIYKVRATDLTVSGLAKLQSPGGVDEVVKSFTIDDSTKTLYMLLDAPSGSTTTTPQLVPLLLYSVAQVSPSFADVAGGVEITVLGDNFFKPPTGTDVLCKMGANYTIGTYVSDTEVRCMTPLDLSPTSSCEGMFMEVSLQNPPQFTSNQIAVTVVPKIQVDSVSPMYAKSSVPQEIIITGYGFVQSRFLGCVFTSAYPTSQASSNPSYVITKATFVSYQSIKCMSPDMGGTASAMSNTIEVTVDYQVLSSNAETPFAILAQATHIEGYFAQSGPAGLQHVFSPDAAAPAYKVVATQNTVLDDFTVQLFDGSLGCGGLKACHFVPYNDYLVDIPNGQLTVSVTMLDNTNGVKFVKNVDAVTMQNGQATFSGIGLGIPQTGVYTLEFTVTTPMVGGLGTWSYKTHVQILSGRPTSLRFKRYNESQIVSLQSQPSGDLEFPFQLEVLDVAGSVIDFTSPQYADLVPYNLVSKTTVMRYATGDRVPLTTPLYIPDLGLDNTIITPTTGSTATFDNYRLDAAKHGVLYKVSFTAENDTSIKALSLYIKGPDCLTSQYGVYGQQSSRCYDCPVGGDCDGSINVAAQVGYWRNMTQAPETAAQQLAMLLASGATGIRGSSHSHARSLLQTSLDYTTLNSTDMYLFHLCTEKDACAGADRYAAQCSAGYSDNLCTKCLDGYGRDIDACLECPSTGVSVVFFIIFLLVVVFIMTILVRAALEDNQLFGKHNAEGRYVSVILKLFWNHLSMIAIIVEFKISWPDTINYLFSVVNTVCNLNVNFRSFNCLFGTNFFGRLCVYVCVPPTVLVMTIICMGTLWYWKHSHGKPTFLAEKIVTANIVITFLLIPVLLRVIADAFLCRTLYGNPWLEAELSYACYTPEHQSWMIVAGAFAIIYGLLLPLGALLAVFKHERQQTLTSRECMNTFGFLYRGYRRARWFWEIIIHLRKVCIVAIVVIGVTEPLLQAYTCLWVISVALLLNLFFVPYAHEFTNKLENFSLATVFTTINIGLLYVELKSKNYDELSIALLVFLMLLNIICILLFLGLFLQKIKVAIYARFDVDGDGDITFGEVWKGIQLFFSGQKPEQKSEIKNLGAAEVEEEQKDAELPPAKEGMDESAPVKQAGDESGLAAPLPPPPPPEDNGAMNYWGATAQALDMSGQYAQPPPGMPGSMQDYPPYQPYQPPPADDLWLRAADKIPPPAAGGPLQEAPGKSVDPWYEQSPQAAGGEYGGSLYGSRDDDESTDKPQTKLRVGLRAPENEERAKIALLTDLYGHSCRSVYLYYCKQYETKPKPQVRLALPDTPNEFNMEELTLNETTLIGNKGLLPVLEVVRLNSSMKSLSVIGNGIKNTGVEWLVHMALDHPSLTSIDLGDNRVTNAAGTVLNYLAQRNPRIVEINITNTRIDQQLKEHIESRLAANRNASQ